jgi:hypothetical protein
VENNYFVGRQHTGESFWLVEEVEWIYFSSSQYLHIPGLKLENVCSISGQRFLLGDRGIMSFRCR